MSCKAIYHGALSKYSGPQDDQVNCYNLIEFQINNLNNAGVFAFISYFQTLANLIKSCLDQANSDGFQTMAIPALGTGFLSYPVPTVARITLDCINNCSATSLQEVLVVIYKPEHNCFKVDTSIFSIFTLYTSKTNDSYSGEYLYFSSIFSR